MHNKKETILIIKHGALGDIILATGAFAAIRAHHPNAHIVLLSSPPYSKMLSAAPWFDEIWEDKRAPLWNIFASGKIYKLLRSKKFTRVYDLQTSRRSSFYFNFLRSPKPEFSGIVRKSPLCQTTPQRTKLHTQARLKDQLAVAGIKTVPDLDINWLKEDFFLPTSSYAALIAGSSAHRLQKRWPAENFIAIGKWLLSQDITPVLIGNNAESSLLEKISAALPQALNLCNQTSLGELTTLLSHAKFALGNDTGPIHLAAAAHCPTIVLFSAASDPALYAPKGEHVQVLQKDNLDDLLVEDVKNAIRELLKIHSGEQNA